MITPTEIIVHLQTYLPTVTTLFNDLKTVISASVTSVDIISVNIAAHGFSPGNNVVISGGTVENGITAAVLDTPEENVIFTTNYEHDFNAPPSPADPTYVILDGFTNPVYNTTHQLTGVPNRNKIQIALPSSETLAPTLNGNEIAIEDRSAGLKGFHQVATVPDVDNFTVQFTGIPDLPLGPVTGLKVLSELRATAVTDLERARELYTEQGSNKLWAFLIMGDVATSRDRHTFNDAVAGFTAQDYNKLTLLHNFEIVVFIPISNDLTPVAAQDLAYNEIYTSLLGVLFGYNNQSSKLNYVTVPVGHGGAEKDNKSWYEHVYDWELPIVVDSDDGYYEGRHVAARDINAIFDLFGDAEAQLEANINLDEEP